MSDKRDIPEDELNLFREAMADVEQRRDDRVPPYRRRRPPRPIEHQPDTRDAPLGDLNVETPAFFEHRQPGIQHRVFHDLQRGLIPPEQSLDLHGMRVVEARKAFARFLDGSAQRGLRCVRIIHGKGRGSQDAQPVLRQKSYQWLLQHPAVLAFVTAPRWDGGTGATYALLSRKAGRDAAR